MRSWVFRNLARLAALRGKQAGAAAPVAAPPAGNPAGPGRPRVRELQPVRRRRPGEQ